MGTFQCILDILTQSQTIHYQAYFLQLIFRSKSPDWLSLPHWNKYIPSMHISHKYFFTFFVLSFYILGEKVFKYSLKQYIF